VEGAGASQQETRAHTVKNHGLYHVRAKTFRALTLAGIETWASAGGVLVVARDGRRWRRTETVRPSIAAAAAAEVLLGPGSGEPGRTASPCS
jgi:hypothetical protein